MLYRERYTNYNTLPGGGIDEGENQWKVDRELTKKTGAQNIRNVEHRLYERVSTLEQGWFWCHADEVLLLHPVNWWRISETSLEDYEVQNVWKAVWINVHDAISINLDTIKSMIKKACRSIEKPSCYID